MSLDEIIHVPARLKIMTYLVENQVATFTELQNTFGFTQGNLSSHLLKLEGAGYVKIIKEFQGRKPVTKIQITPEGINAYKNYVNELIRLLKLDNAK